MRTYKGNIFLGSETIEPEVLDKSKALVSAFFPYASVKTGVVPAVSRAGMEPEHVLIQVEEEDGAFKAIWYGRGLEGAGDPAGSRGLGETSGALKVLLPEAEVERLLKMPRPGKESSLSLLTKQVLVRLLTSLSGEVLPWGILTGIRPTKLVHRMNDMGWSRAEQESTLKVLYGIRPDKIRLLQAVAAVQEPYLQTLKRNPERVGLYIGIPFCPSRCSYCSFPAYVESKGRQEMPVYLKVLKQEIRAVGELMQASGLEGDTLYFGGGTPTVLSAEELLELFRTVKKFLPLSSELELTVEAGRPDTLSPEKLKSLAEIGTSRLSINPQTMQEKTLKRIGRAHHPENVVEMYRLARAVRDWVINMDVILGLPGEGLDEFKVTLEQLEPLRPDNLTVHALALKRGARERELRDFPVEAALAEQMQAYAENTAHAWGMQPYYLYRQKRIAGNLENIGYALPGREARYNIAIMEERQSIIGLGAGAASKILCPTGEGLTNLQQPTGLQAYEANWQLLHARRLAAFGGGFGSRFS